MAPRVTFSEENKAATTNYDYPKLKLKVGERARILILEDPVMEYVHDLRKPQIINGEPQFETKKDKSGKEYRANVMDFVSRPICLGDATILGEKGSDPANCPACKLAQTNPDMAKPPKRRFAMHVIRYRTKGGSTDLAQPYSVETLVWSFTDQVFNKIADAKQEWKDLRKHDLLLGPCQAPEHFQKFDISVASSAAWLESEERKQLTAITFKENQIPDLTIAAGSVKQKTWVEQDVADIKEMWAQVAGASQADTTSLDEGLEGLLDSPAKSASAKASIAKDEEGWTTPEAAASDPMMDLDVSLPATSASADVPDLDAPASSPEPTPADAGVDNFEDLLADL